MDRKTIRLKDGMVALIRDEGECSKVGEAIDRLADLEDKLERGEMVEVVRCKDCKHNDCAVSNRSGWCSELERVMNNDEFCSSGERREDA